MAVVEDKREDLVAGDHVDPLRVQAARHHLVADLQWVTPVQQNPFVRPHRRRASNPSRRSRLPPKRFAKCALSIPAMLAITASSCSELALLAYGRSEPYSTLAGSIMSR